VIATPLIHLLIREADLSETKRKIETEKIKANYGRMKEEEKVKAEKYINIQNNMPTFTSVN
jgi:hypothetical protein